MKSPIWASNWPENLFNAKKQNYCHSFQTKKKSTHLEFKKKLLRWGGKGILKKFHLRN
jgi:hypothetical protein